MSAARATLERSGPYVVPLASVGIFRCRRCGDAGKRLMLSELQEVQRSELVSKVPDGRGFSRGFQMRLVERILAGEAPAAVAGELGCATQVITSCMAQ
jgi:hypothetical protein